MSGLSTFYTNNCPYTDSSQEIHLYYAEINILGQLKPGRKYLGYTCDLIDECPYPSQDNYGRCPVAISFFKSVNESL